MLNQIIKEFRITISCSKAITVKSYKYVTET